jgi:hypothetical protein
MAYFNPGRIMNLEGSRRIHSFRERLKSRNQDIDYGSTSFCRRIRALLILLLAAGWLLPWNTTLAEGPAFHSILVKNLKQLTPATSFSKNDQIYLYTVWTGLTGDHELKVLWVRPDKKVQETTRFKVKIPPNTRNYTTWAWLSFKKGLLDFMASDAIFIGPWKARLFLDDKFLAEYPFSVL